MEKVPAHIAANIKARAEYRQVRAVYDEETITVYQAYQPKIASAAVEHQKLDASPLFNVERMTWIKPSWCWVNYRSGYATKPNQERILALKLKHEGFLTILRKAEVSDSKRLGPRDGVLDEHGLTRVMVQWDPERSYRLGKLDYRSIQIGIKGVNNGWHKWIVGIEDVTDKARKLETMVKEDKDNKLSTEKVVAEGLMPEERHYEMPEDLKKSLHMGTEKEQEG